MLTYKGHYSPKYPNKYLGTTPIIYRSSWELCFMKWCDDNSNVVHWGSESVVIPYLCEIDNKYHKYYVDFNVTFKNGETYLIEIKPQSKTKLPSKPKSGRQTRAYQNQVLEYIQNECKWKAAKKYADSMNVKFNVWTEITLKNLGIKILT